MMDWQETSLGEVMANKGYIRGPFGSALKRGEMLESGIPVYEQANAIYNHRKFRYFIDSNKHKSLSRFTVKPNDILISCSGTFGKTTIIKDDDPLGIISQALLILRSNPDKINIEYLNYYLNSREGKRKLAGMSHGSVQVNLAKRADVESIELKLPPLTEQKAIANVLTAFDDKIELLQQQNTTLEAIAQTIFKEWFGKYQVGDVLPDGWRVGKIGDLTEIKRGGSPRPIQDYISDSGYRWLKISDATATDSPYIFEIKEHIKIEGLKKTTLKKAGDLVLSNSATPGMPKFLAVDTCVHDGWMHFPRSVVSNEYLYLLFLHIRPRLVQQGSGSVFVNLKTDILRQFEITIPSKTVFIDFDNLIKPIFNKIYNNAIQIQSQTKTRDSLLPKLMSGQVRVNM